MAYTKTKTNWVIGDQVTPATMNSVETGIEATATVADSAAVAAAGAQSTANTALATANQALAGSGGGGGTTDHAQLTNRTAADSHPMSAITGLTAAIAAKADATAVVNLTTAQTIGGVKTFSQAPVFPPNSIPQTAVNGLTAALSAPQNLSQLVPGTMVQVVKAQAIFGTAGSWPATRPSLREDIYFVWVGDTDPGDIARPWELRIIT